MRIPQSLYWNMLLFVIGLSAGPAGPGAASGQEPEGEPGTAAAVTASDETSQEELIKELDAFRDSLFHAFNEGEYAQMLQDHCHPDVIATWQDGTSGQGFDAVLAEFEKLSEFIDVMKVAPITDLRLVLNDGNLVVAAGQMNDTYKMANGFDFALESRWSATLIKQDGQWKLITFSATTDGFDNQVIAMSLWTRTILVASIAVVVGLIIGFAATRIFAGRSARSDAQESQ